jgi:hypothetical protein
MTAPDPQPCGCTATHLCEAGAAAFRELIRHRARWLAVPGCRERGEAHRSDEVDQERASRAGGGVGCRLGAEGEVREL